MFRKVEINIPLLDAIKQVPKYAKFLEELCVHKRKKMKGNREIGGVVSALTRNKELTAGAPALPKKCRDPGIFSVPCTIGECTFADAMLDLGASINVMPASIYRSLNFGNLEPIGMTIQLAKRSIVQPLGVLEDVLVQVNELLFPADFYVLDMEDETSGKESTLILGRPFLMTARTKIDVHAGMLSMDYRRLNQATRKDHFPLPFIDQVLEKLARKSHYYFLDGAEELTHICPYSASTKLGPAIELMCDASKSALGAVLDQRAGVDQPMHDKFRSYLLDSKIIVFSDQNVLRYLLKKLDAKPRLIRWMLLLQEFDIEIRIKKGAENFDRKRKRTNAHLRRIPKQAASEHQSIHTMRHLGYIKKNFRVMPNIKNGMIPTFGDYVRTKCILDVEINSVLQFCHSTPGGGHYGSTRTAKKVLDYGLYWPTMFRDTHHFVSTCERCQKVGMTMNQRHEMPQQPILFCEVLIWVEAITTKTNDAKAIVDFLKSNIFYRFGMPKALISDQGSHFCNRAMTSLLQKYGVMHRISTAYHRQTNGQAEVFNREIKKTLQKMTNPSKKD
ncbi:gag-pol, partial [Mucuna pruriens]